jgi:hypothetical protein
MCLFETDAQSMLDSRALNDLRANGMPPRPLTELRRFAQAIRRASFKPARGAHVVGVTITKAQPSGPAIRFELIAAQHGVAQSRAIGLCGSVIGSGNRTPCAHTEDHWEE